MKEPLIRVGFIILRPEYEEELETSGIGHWKTARKWIKEKGLQEIMQKVCADPDNDIWDEEDFLIQYVGAIKLHCMNGVKKAYIPRVIINKEYISYLKRYYRSLGYVIYGNVGKDTDEKEQIVCNAK